MSLTSGALEQKIGDVDRDAKEAHDRNHERFDELKARVDIIDAIVKEHTSRLPDIDRRLTEQGSRLTGQDRRHVSDHKEQLDRKIEATQVRFTAQQMIAVAIFCVSLYAGAITGPWLLNAGLRTDVATILQEQKSQQQIVSSIQVQQAQDIKDLKADEKLHTIQINNLRDRKSTRLNSSH